MRLIVNEKNGCCESVSIEYTPTEALVINQAMRNYADNEAVKKKVRINKMKLIAKAYEIDDDYDLNRIEEGVLKSISEDLEIIHDISFYSLEKESQMALISEIFKRLKKVIENEAF